MASRIIGDRPFQGSVIEHWRRVGPLIVLVVLAWASTACSARYLLADTALNEARAAEALKDLYPLVSNRTIVTYDRRGLGQTQLGRTVRKQSSGRRLIRILSRNKRGIIVDETLRNGAPVLWVSFEPRKCTEAACAFSFVRGDDGRYHLMSLPEIEGFDPPKVYRGIVSKRNEMKRGKMRSLADANPVYQLQRKRERKRHRTVFLELKKKIKRRTIRDIDNIEGR